jgi:hypothetical protein
LNNSLFEDMGDEAAKREGLAWDPFGQVVDLITRQDPNG